MSSREGVFVSARTRDEYEGMFDLSFSRWGEKVILDCGAGGASFAAEWSAAGGVVTACDPLFGQPLPVQEEAVRSGVERAARNIVEEPEMYVWEHFESPAAHRAAREHAADAFLTDRRAHPERYVSGSLPNLPFTAGKFDLVVSSHLLFAYCRTISIEDHIRYVDEMVRVASEEVRLYPIVGFEGDADDKVASVVDALAAKGLSAERRRSRYHLLRGAQEYLAIHLR